MMFAHDPYLRSLELVAWLDEEAVVKKYLSLAYTDAISRRVTAIAFLEHEVAYIVGCIHRSEGRKECRCKKEELHRYHKLRSWFIGGDVQVVPVIRQGWKSEPSGGAVKE